MLNEILKKCEIATGLAELQQTVIVTFTEDNYRIELFKDSDPKNSTPYHIRVYDQVFEQTDGGDEGEPKEKTMIVGIWRELLQVPECKSASAQDCLQQAIKILSDIQSSGDD
jgi:hypothetical protein